MSRLMARPWFSRRWVVQEIALARKTTIHCGDEELAWQDFTDAVSLINEVEPELSKIVKTKTEFDHIPDFFAHVSAMSATKLVNATSNLLCRSKVEGTNEIQAKPLLSLEYLVSTLSSFEASVPHDTISALLAIARDTEPNTQTIESADVLAPAIKQQLVEWGNKRISSETYAVKYALPLFDVCRDFIIFAIRKSEGQRL